MHKNAITIANHKVGSREPVFVIAEAGVNHNGSLRIAMKLIDAAKDAGADAVKFQTFRAEEVVTAQGRMATYQRRNVGYDASPLALLKKLELNEEFYQPLLRHCQRRNIIFLSTPHGGFTSVDLLNALSMPAFKFGSGDVTNIPVLQYAAKLNKPIILATGMATMAEVQTAVGAIKAAGNERIVVMHATTNYPCPAREVNLRAMQTMQRECGVLVGYSDHTLGTQVAVMAATLGAVVIEKHLTLDRSMAGPDHRASATPGEFKRMVDGIREVAVILGSAVKQPTKAEIANRKIARKSIVTLTDIKAGEVFTGKNIGVKRPGTGLAPRYYYDIIGRQARRSIAAGRCISTSDISQTSGVVQTLT